nr:hypothetical protein [Chloroflexota bacterium]
NDQGRASISVGPTAISLVRFTAAPYGQAISVRWTTSGEMNTWGFYVYRSADGTRAHARRVTPALVLGRGRGQGASYAWIDTTSVPGSHDSYWLQEVELNGTTNEYGPATLLNGPAIRNSQIFLPLVVR